MALHANSQWLGESRSLPWRGEICGSYLHRTRLVSRAHCFRRDFRPRSPLHRRIHYLTRLWRERDGINRIFRCAWAGARVDHIIFRGRTGSSFDLLEPGENVGGESASHARYGKAGGIVRNCPTSCGRHDLEKAIKGVGISSGLWQWLMLRDCILCIGYLVSKRDVYYSRSDVTSAERTLTTEGDLDLQVVSLIRIRNNEHTCSPSPFTGWMHTWLSTPSPPATRKIV